VVTRPPARPNPAGALCYILDDEDRTRRLLLLLLPVVLVVVHWPVGLGAGTVLAAWGFWRRRRVSGSGVATGSES
jgi:hypothetical protein